MRLLNEPAHDKTYNKTCVTSEDGRLLFCFSDKIQDKLSICSKKQGIYVCKLDAIVYGHC